MICPSGSGCGDDIDVVLHIFPYLVITVAAPVLIVKDVTTLAYANIFN